MVVIRRVCLLHNQGMLKDVIISAAVAHCLAAEISRVMMSMSKYAIIARVPEKAFDRIPDKALLSIVKCAVCFRFSLS